MNFIVRPRILLHKLTRTD